MLHFGHIHKPFQHESPDNIVYPGSTISFGFDELGERGMMSVEIDGQNVTKKEFIKLDERTFEELEIDISEINSEEELIETVNSLKLQENTMYKLILTGSRNFEININKIAKLILQDNIIKIKNHTKLNQDIEKILQEKNLKSFFIKEVLEKSKDQEIDVERTKRILEIGLDVL